MIKRHWMSLSAGVVTAVVVAVTSSVWLARGFMLSDEIQRSLAVRSVTTPLRWRRRNRSADNPIWWRCLW
ncbi:CidA-associated membrane protein CidB [Klebsiella pneumoniae]|uniref:CidA-associated membrane protein CidB n=1 Tax=Klebsiella pneumoniae TaxID=573 RepID=A0A377ZQ98_KLEPN|nr:CidA-associated membrane protein CidB [Klebsiella pneumoniae]